MPFWDEFSWMKISEIWLKFLWNFLVFPWEQLTISQHLFEAMALCHQALGPILTLIHDATWYHWTTMGSINHLFCGLYIFSGAYAGMETEEPPLSIYTLRTAVSPGNISSNRASSVNLEKFRQEIKVAVIKCLFVARWRARFSTLSHGYQHRTTQWQNCCIYHALAMEIPLSCWKP